jgi:hypothetical protein
MGVISSLAGKTSEIVVRVVDNTVEYTAVIFTIKWFTDTAVEVTRLASSAAAA